MIKVDDIITIPITEDILLEAIEFKYPINKKSYMNGARHSIGALGEIVVKRYFESLGYKIEYSHEYDYDLLLETLQGQLKIDVKAKKRAPCEIHKYIDYKGHGFEGSVQAELLGNLQKKDLDFYVFVSYDGVNAYIIGCMSKNNFIKTSFKVNDLKVDNFNIFYKELDPVSKLICNTI